MYIFSNQSASQIDNVIKQFFENRRISLDKVLIHDLKWNELSKTFEDVLFTKPIPLHINSKTTFTLKEISAKNQQFLNVLRGNQLLEITQPHKICLLTHNVPEVLCYIPRNLRSSNHSAYDEDDFLDSWLLGKNIKQGVKSSKRRNKKASIFYNFYSKNGKTNILS